MISISMSGLHGCGCSSPVVMDNIQESQTETVEETQEPTPVETTEVVTIETSITEVATETETEEELGLLDIFRPSTHTDENGNWITTSDQYGILQTFDITAETHYIDWLPEQIMAEIMMNGEENVNDDMVAEIIKYVGELNLKGAYTDEELEEETLRLLDFFAETEGGYIDESGLWVSAEEHWKRTGRTPGGQGNEDTGIEILEASGTKYAKDSVNVRSEANKDSDKLGSLNWADEVEITGITSDGKWTRIEFNGGEGFVSSSYLLDEKPEKQKPSGGNNGGSDGGSNGGSEAEQPNNGGGDSGNSGADDWEGLSGDWGGHGNGENIDHDRAQDHINSGMEAGGLGDKHLPAIKEEPAFGLEASCLCTNWFPFETGKLL